MIYPWIKKVKIQKILVISVSLNFRMILAKLTISQKFPKQSLSMQFINLHNNKEGPM